MAQTTVEGVPESVVSLAKQSLQDREVLMSLPDEEVAVYYTNSIPSQDNLAKELVDIELARVLLRAEDYETQIIKALERHLSGSADPIPTPLEDTEVPSISKADLEALWAQDAESWQKWAGSLEKESFSKIPIRACVR